MIRTYLSLMLGLSTVPAIAHAADERCTVWQRELSFAQSVRQHDPAAFAGHVETDAVFSANTPHPQRGRTSILTHWRGLIDGKDVHLSWYPTQVVTGGVTGLAYSSGPWLMEAIDPAARPRFVAGHFATVWHRGEDGIWRVLFDGGDEGAPIDEAGAAAFRKARQAACPAAGHP